MNKSVFIVTLFVVMHEVQLQRSPYAGSANRFRGQPMNLVLGTVPTTISRASVPSVSASPGSQAIVPPVSTFQVSQDGTPISASPVSRTSFPSVSTGQQSVTTNTGKHPQVFTPSRFSNDYFSNRYYDEHRNFHQVHGKRDFNDFSEYDY